MMAVSLWQPFASAIATGAKEIETRSWRAPKRLVGREIAIHAAMRHPYGVIQELFPERWRCPKARGSIIRDFLVSAGQNYLDHLPGGCVVAVATLAACVPTDEIELAQLDRRERSEWGKDDDGEDVLYGLDERDLGDFSPGRWAWILEDVQRVRAPVVCRGNRGIFAVPVPVETAVRGRLDCG